MKRRNFIMLSASGAAALGAGYWYLNYYEPPYPVFLAEPGALAQLWDEATIREVGAAYRRQVPAEASEAVLVSRLAGAPDGAPPDVAALRSAIQRDFAVGRTVLLDGWVLAVTEARQCALFSIANP
jgi:hypothetical protein